MLRSNGGRFGAVLLATSLITYVSTPVRANDGQADNIDAKATEQSTEAEPAGKPVALNKFNKRKRSTRAARMQKPRVIAKGYRRKALEAAAVPIDQNESEPAAMSDTVANANAQWPSSDAGVQPAVATPSPAQMAGSDIVAPDQLNDLDKNLSETPNGDDVASQIATRMAQQIAPNPSQAAGVNVPATATPAMSATTSADRTSVASNGDNAWGQSSLIGKIFIAFGGLLTVASAARLFMV